MLTNSLKLSDITKADIFQLYFTQSDEKIGQKWWSVDFSSVLDPLARLLYSGALEWGFLDNFLTTFLGVRNFGNT